MPSPLSKPKEEEDLLANVRPWDPEAKKFAEWHQDSVEDCFGRYPFIPPTLKERPKIMNTVLEAIGGTPLVKLNRIPAEYGIECNIYGKCEFLNAGGSVKDRIAVRMLQIAEQTGRLRPGMTIIEPTSGNTGIGLALACAIKAIINLVKGYRCIIVMPDRMSKEKEIIIKALGAEIVRTHGHVHFDSDESHIGKAFKLQREIPGSIVLDQYKNCANPLAHYEGTAEEIVEALDGKVDMVVIGVDTGGTITGIARKIHNRCPNCKIIGVDPIGSVLSSAAANKDHQQKEEGHGRRHGFQVEGIGYDFVPSVLDHNLIDAWEEIGDPETFQMARQLIRKEGILSGGSAGAILAGALRAAVTLKRGQNCVILLPDGVRNYLTKFMDDQWMLSHEFEFMPSPSQQNDAHLQLDGLLSQCCQKEMASTAVYHPEKKAQNDCQIVAEPWPSSMSSRLGHCQVLADISAAIGNTPLVRLQKIPKEYGVDAEILVKCEFLNPSGSAKDRIAQKMVEMAEAKGLLKPGESTIIEPTLGNTGIALAMMAATRGYRCILVVPPEEMCHEKECVLRALGAQIVLSPNGKMAHFEPDSHIGIAIQLQRQIPGAIILDQQFQNEGNPLAHYEGTAEEIIWACNGQLDAVVIGVDTGGTVTGVAKRMREKVPKCRIIAAIPEGSILANPSSSSCKERRENPSELDGISVHDFVPSILDRSLIHDWIKINDANSFRLARELIKKEGILCGGSTGANVWAALKIAKELGPECRRIVVMAPDGIRNYMTKFLDDDWMRSRGFMVENDK